MGTTRQLRRDILTPCEDTSLGPRHKETEQRNTDLVPGTSRLEQGIILETSKKARVDKEASWVLVGAGEMAGPGVDARVVERACGALEDGDDDGRIHLENVLHDGAVRLRY